jgi:integrase
MSGTMAYHMPRKPRSLKRSDGEGTISKRRDKSGKIIGYKGAVPVGFTLQGKPDRRWVSGITEADVREKMETIKNARNIGTLANTEDITIGAYLERWMAYKQADGTRLKTTSRYEQSVKRQLIPALGKYKLEKLRPLDVKSVLVSIRELISAKEARRARTILSMALNQAVRWQMIPRNVCQAVKPPVIPHEEEKEIRYWTPEEAGRHLKGAITHRHYALFYVGLMTGMRACELLGLRWQDVDFKSGILRIEQDAVSVQGKMIIGSVKTRASRRTITISLDTVAVLQQHLKHQAIEKHNAQEGYRDLDLVFASEVGTVTGYHNLRKVFLQLIAQINIKGWQDAGLLESSEARKYEDFKALLKKRPELTRTILVPEIGLHGLRHTHASVLICRGMNVKVVSERLGHTSVAFTLKTYAHLFDEQRREAAISLEEFLGSGEIAPNSVASVTIN